MADQCQTPYLYLEPACTIVSSNPQNAGFEIGQEVLDALN
jgi:hypothetical protein